MKVSELTGELLDYWVAKAEGLEIKLTQLPPDNNTYAVHYYAIFSPSTSWTTGGPIIEREKISRVFMGEKWHAMMPSNGRLAESNIDAHSHEFDEVGETDLIAAMRAYVASKFGDEVLD